MTGDNLPIIVLSHGHGPIANFWAAHDFVVIQPTHMNAQKYSIDSKAPEAPLFWRSNCRHATWRQIN